MCAQRPYHLFNRSLFGVRHLDAAETKEATFGRGFRDLLGDVLQPSLEKGATAGAFSSRIFPICVKAAITCCLTSASDLPVSSDFNPSRAELHPSDVSMAAIGKFAGTRIALGLKQC